MKCLDVPNTKRLKTLESFQGIENQLAGSATKLRPTDQSSGKLSASEKQKQVATDARTVNVPPSVCLSISAAGADSSPFLLDTITRLPPYLGLVLDAARQHFDGDTWLSLMESGASDLLCSGAGSVVQVSSFFWFLLLWISYPFRFLYACVFVVRGLIAIFLACRELTGNGQ